MNLISIIQNYGRKILILKMKREIDLSTEIEKALFLSDDFENRKEDR